jgi:ABC-2 type transport system permease protein
MFNPTIATITVRALLGRKRALLLAAPGLVLLFVTLVLKAVHGSSTSWPSEILGRVGYSAILPLTALIVGTSVLGSEIDDNSILHLLATPVRRASVVFTKAVVAAGVTIAFAAIPELIAATIARGTLDGFAIGLTAGAALGSFVYCGFFVLLSTMTRHSVAYALGYVALWEGLITNLIGGAKYLSVEQYSLGVANAIAKSNDLNAHLTAPTAIILAAIATAACLWTAGTRLRSFTLTGDA